MNSQKMEENAKRKITKPHTLDETSKSITKKKSKMNIPKVGCLLEDQRDKNN